MNWLSILDKAYYLDDQPRVHVLRAVGFASFVFFFLWIFTPFGLDRIEGGALFAAFGFALVTLGIMLLLNVVIPLTGWSYFDPESWTVYRELNWTMINIGGIGLCNYLFFVWLYSGLWSLTGLLWFEMVTLGVSLFPMAFMILRKEAKAYKRYADESTRLNPGVRKRHETFSAAEGNEIHIVAQNEKESIQCPSGSLVLISAADNYISVYILEKGIIVRKLLRQTIQEAERQVSGTPSIFRCHRSYMVNLDHVNNIYGNAQGYKLDVDGIDFPVPVSRANNAAIQKAFVVRP